MRRHWLFIVALLSFSFCVINIVNAADANTPGWMVFTVPALAAPEESASSVAFLNTGPAGAHGFIRVENGHFVDDRGEPLRFYGTNFSGESNFPHDRKSAEGLAKRLRQFGMNVVRIHGLEADHPYYLKKGLQCWDENGDFSEAQLRKVDELIAAMNREGVYVIMNLHVGWTYPVFEGGFAPNAHMLKINGYWYRPFIERQKMFADKIMGRINTVTGVRYADNPGIMSVEMNNEDTFIEHGNNAAYYELSPGYGPRKIYPKLPEPLKQVFRANWTAFLENKYGTMDALRCAWKTDTTDPKSNNTNLLDGGQDFEHGIHVPAANEGVADRDFREFSLQTQIATALELKQHLRELGVKVPIINTQTPYGGVSGQWATHLADDYCDTHDYFQHPNFNGLQATTENSAIVANPHGGTLPMSAILREKGKPFVISESATPNHNDHGADMLPLNSIFLSIQDIDGLMTHAYAHCTNTYDENIGMDAFMLAGRANVIVHYPFAALLYRQRRMPSAIGTTTLVAPTFDMLDNSALDYSTQHLLAYRTAGSHTGSYASRYYFEFDPTISAPFLRGKASAPKEDASGAIVSEDGSFRLYRHAKPGPYASLNLPDAKMVTGHVGGSSFTVGDVKFDFEDRPWPNPDLPAFSCTTLISLDGKSIAESKKMLLASSGMTEAQNLTLSEDRKTVSARVSNSWGNPPNVSETVAFSITLPGNAYKLTALDGAGMPTDVSRNSVDGKVDITHSDCSLWFLIER